MPRLVFIKGCEPFAYWVTGQTNPANGKPWLTDHVGSNDPQWFFQFVDGDGNWVTPPFPPAG